MEGFDIYKILEIVFPLIAILLGAKFAVAKTKLSNVVTLMANVDKALADNLLSQEEMKTIVADVLRLLGKDVLAVKP